ncbi:MAG: fibronectin type III domain-containing protein [Treponema sp.]|nr:fibronectin type III domain-containing protein [Treponema sp.]
MKLLLSMTAAAVILLMGVGCPNFFNGNGDDDESDTFQSGLPPENPVITKSETAFELVDTVVLKNFSAGSLTDDQQSAVVALKWTGEGAITYNLYWNDENSRPPSPGLTGLTGTGAFARNLKAETEYYFWVEAVNPNGTAVSAPYTKKTGKKGTKASGGIERGDYPRGGDGRFTVVPGNGSLTLTWDLFDRVGWYEVYYAPVGTINHVDIYSPVEFRYDSAKDLKSGAVDISGVPNAGSVAYQNNGAQGHTRPVYPFLTPLAANGGWEGYYVRDGASRVDADTRPILGLNDLPNGRFYKIMEIYDKDLAEPYKALDSAFAQAIPWDGTKAGTAGTPVKFFGTGTTITGLQNGTTYEVWLRCPNANGERGYGYVVGTPGSATLQAPSNVQVATPENTTRQLTVSWNPVTGAEGYRIYVSKYDYSPQAGAAYTPVSGGDTKTYTLNGLDSNTTYYIWVVAEKKGAAGAAGTPVSGKTGTAPATGKSGDKIIPGTGAKVKTIVYIEVNDDNPLNAGSYILEDGTYLFDHVTLFAANIRNRNCAKETSEKHGCKENGPHVHLNENVRHILQNRNKYLKPLQDKGIKVLLGLLGDHDGIGFGSMSDKERETFIADLKQDVELYGLDGVDFDDEWASKEDWNNWTNSYTTISPNSIWTYPTSTWGYPIRVTVFRNPGMGITAGNGTFDAPSAAEMNRMWKESGETYYKTIQAARNALGPDKIVTLYEYNTGRYITAGGAANTTATKEKLQSVINFVLQPWYNQYIPDSANGLPNAIYSPFGMDLSGEGYSQGNVPYPPIVVDGSEKADKTIYDFATRFKKAATDDNNPYNVLYFYGLEPARELLKRASTDSAARITKEEYISMMTGIIFGQKCILTTEGGNYPKDW